MAARLTVIISQSTAGHAELEETLLAELMMTAGLDVTLVGSLARVQIDSTDHLCLSSLGQNLALVTELPVDVAAQHWKRLGLLGELMPWGAGQLTSERRIYHLPLAQGVRPIVAQLKHILSDKQVRTVNLILPLARRPGTPARVQSPHSSQSQSPQSLSAQSLSAGLQSAVSQPGESQLGESQPASSHPSLPESEAAKHFIEDDELEFAELDKLVDDLDALDL